LKNEKKMDVETRRDEQLDYYIMNRSEFGGEDGHHKLVAELQRYIPTLHKKTLGLDVGANVGNELGVLDTLCKEQGRKLIAFEPNPLNIPLLKESITKFQDVEIQPIAVSDKEGVLPFFTFQNHENEPGYTWGGLRAGGKQIGNVVVRPLDDILRDYPSEEWDVKYVKIDTEGNDTLVIRGLQKNLYRTHYILFEASDCLKDRRGPGEKNPLETCVNLLDEEGFDVYRLGTKRLLKLNGELWHPAYDNLLMWSNCFALKKQDRILSNFLNEDGYYL
jgi:FkbM family methyltransferase